MAISITKPQIGGSENTWGDEINDALDVIVDAVNGTTGTTSPNLSSFSVDGTVVTATAAELNLLSGVTATTAEINYIDGVTGNIQTQLNQRAELSGANFTGAVDVNASVTANSFALDNGADDWTFEVSANKLIIKYSGVAKLEIDTSGNLTAVGDVNTNGTIS
jgi:hypothetical protein